jgi:hypothetical protein
VAIINPATGGVSYAPFHDSFDAGTLNFPDTWNVDTSVPGQVTVHTSNYYLNSGMMEATAGASTGHGYGTYTVNAMLQGIWPGSAIMLWPGNNQWSGGEIDMAELVHDGSGRHMGVLHWPDPSASDGDSYDLRVYDPVVLSNAFHEYQVVWEPQKLTMKVDGVERAVFTEHVPADYAHGGVDRVFAFLNLHPETGVVVTDVTYQPLGAEPATATAAPPVAAPAASSDPWAQFMVNGQIDWDAAAAHVTANHEATGQWFI